MRISQKTIILINIIITQIVCYNILEIGVPIEQGMHDKERQSFLINGIGKLDELQIQLNILYGKVQFAVDIYDKTRQYTNLDLNSYKYTSNILSNQYNKHSLSDYQISVPLTNVYSLPSKEISNKLKKLLLSQKLIVTVQAHSNSKYRLVGAQDRIYLQPNSTFEFYLPKKQNSMITFVLQSNQFFLLNTSLKNNQAKMIIHRLIKDKQQQQSNKNEIYDLQKPIKDILKDREVIFDQIIDKKELLQIGNKIITPIEYTVSFENTIEDNGINVLVNWSNLSGQDIMQSNSNNNDTYYGKMYDFFIGYRIPKGKQFVKITIMITITISFLIYALSFIIKNMTQRKYKSQWYDDDQI